MNAALAGLHPMQYDPLQKNQVQAAIGSYRNKQAVAVGLSHYINENFMLSAGIAAGEGHKTKAMANVGFSWKIGSEDDREDLPKRYSKGPIGSIYIMQQEMDNLLKENSQQKNQLKQQEQEIVELRNMIEDLYKRINK